MQEPQGSQGPEAMSPGNILMSTTKSPRATCRARECRPGWPEHTGLTATLRRSVPSRQTSARELCREPCHSQTRGLQDSGSRGDALSSCGICGRGPWCPGHLCSARAWAPASLTTACMPSFMWGPTRRTPQHHRLESLILSTQPGPRKRSHPPPSEGSSCSSIEPGAQCVPPASVRTAVSGAGGMFSVQPPPATSMHDQK